MSTPTAMRPGAACESVERGRLKSHERSENGQRRDRMCSASGNLQRELGRVEGRFLVSSADYVRWVDAEEERSLSQAPQSDPSALTKAFFEARRQERAKDLSVGRLEQRLLDLEQQPGDRDNRTRKLEKQLRDKSQKLQRSKHRQQRLARDVGRLEQQLENMRASRVWKLAEMLRHIKAGLKSLRGSSR